MKYLQGNYKVEAASATLLLNKALKKMTTDGRLVAGAQAGKSGAGCYKVSMEEKTRMVEKASAKKRAAAEKGALKKVVGKKSASKKTGTKVMKKVSKASAGAKAKKG